MLQRLNSGHFQVDSTSSFPLVQQNTQNRDSSAHYSDLIQNMQMLVSSTLFFLAGAYMITDGNDDVLFHLILSVNIKIPLKSEKFKSIVKHMR